MYGLAVNRSGTGGIASRIVMLLALLCPMFGLANPVGGVVSGGQALITTNVGAVDIHQQSDRAVIDWQGFDIAHGERTEFHQPTASAIALNRVHSTQASVINGTLKANGNVLVVNQNGVLFGKTAVVDVNGLVATTADVDNTRFLNDRTPRFDKPGNPDAAIINQGSITAKDSGLVGFVAPHVENSGVITARLGRVHLAAGDTTTVDFYGDGLMEVAVSDDVHHQLVRNTGSIRADGGTVALTAAAGHTLLSNAIEVQGTLQAQSIAQRGGTIVISSLGNHAVAGNAPAAKGKNPALSSTVMVAGRIDASGRNAGERGGRITVTADAVNVEHSTTLDASGSHGGGIIHVGGEYLGRGVTPTALTTTIARGATFDASATAQGHGGEVIVFADGTTHFAGLVNANGAGTRGNGGFVETSGKGFLDYDGTVRAIASGNGLAGTWLLDPADITITAATNANVTGSTPFTANAAGGSQLSAATIVAALNGGTNVTVQTSNDAFAGNGDIFVNSAITTSGTGSLTLSAFRNITVNSGISLLGGTLTLRADNTGIGSGAVTTAANLSTTTGDITIGGGSGAITAATYNANGSILAAATGYANGNAAMSQGVTIGGAVTSTSGNIIINGRGFNGTASSIGVEQLVGNAITTGGAGTIRISGIAQGTAGNGNQNSGVTLRNNVTAAAGVIQINGQGGGGTSTYNTGILISNSGGVVRTTGAGAITLSGIGGTSSGGKNHGVLVNNTSGVSPTGSGTVLIYGQGGTAGTNNAGVEINDGGSGSIVGGGGAITINGTGGTTSGGSNYGVGFVGTGAGIGSLTNSGAGTITITGTGAGSGASSNNHGIFVSGTGATISTTGSGAITLTGTGGGGTGGTNHGVFSNVASGIINSSTGSLSISGTAGSGAGSVAVASAAANGIRTSASGNITLLGNSFNLSAANAVNSAGTLTIAPLTAVTFGLGTGAGVATIDNTSLGNIAATGGFTFGSATAGAVTVNTTVPFTSRALTFISAAGITLTNAFDALTSLTTTAPTGVTTINGVLGGTTPIGSYSGTGQDLIINANLTSNSNVTAAFTRDITIGAGATVTNGSASALSLQAAGGSTAGTGNLTINGNINAGTGNLTLLSGINVTRPSWVVTTTNLLRQGATFGATSITGFLDLTFNRDLNSSANITLTSFRDLTLNALNTLTTGATGALNLQAANGSTGGTGNLNLNGNVSVGTGGVTFRSGANGTRPSWTATTTNFVPQSTFGFIDIQGFQDITLNRDITSTNNVTINAFRDLTLNAANTITNGATFALTLYAANANTGGTGNLNLNGTLSAGSGTVTLRSGVNGTRPSYTLTTSNFARQGATFGTLDIQGFNDTLVNRDLLSSGSITIVSTRDLTLNAANTITTGAAGSLNLQAASGTVTNTGNLTLNNTVSVGTGSLTLRSGVNGTRPSWTANTTSLVLQGATVGAVDIRGFLDTFINRDLPSSNNVVVIGFRDVTLNAANTITSGAANGLNIQAANGSTGGTGVLNLNGTLSNGTGALTLSSGINGTRSNWTATTTNLIRQGATFGTLNIQGFGNFNVNRVFNSSAGVTIANNTLTTLQNDITSTGSNIAFTTNPIVVAEGFSPTISTTNANITFNAATIADTVGGATEGLTLSTGTGTITSNSTIDGVALNANGGGLALTGVMGGTRALGNSTLTATTATQLILPTISALSLNASTTAAGSQLTINGALTTTGATGLSLTSPGAIVKTGAGNLSSGTGPMALNAGGALIFANAGTNLTSTGGNITLTSPVGIINSQTLTVNTGNGNLSYVGPVVVGAPLTLTLGTGTANFSSTINGAASIPTFDVLLVGGGGGGGGGDVVAGAGGGGGGVVDTTVNTSLGSSYTVFVAGGGGGAASATTSAGRGGGGTNGGANGGNAGNSGTSGGGAGGGGFSGIAIGGTYYGVAGGGAGGGGANEGTANDVVAPGGGSQPNGNTGTTNGGAGSAFAGDGGGGGGGGGGFLGGNGQTNLLTSGQASGGSNYYNPANVTGSITNGNDGATQAGGAAGGAAVSATRAAYFGYGNNAGAGGNGVTSGTGGAGGTGVTIIRYTGSTAQSVATGTFTTTTVGGDTIITYSTAGSHTFAPISGCNGGCNLTITAGNVNFGGTIGATTALGALSVNATNGFILPTTIAGSVTATGRTYLNGNITTPNGAVTFNSPVYLLTNSAINTGSGIVTFASTVDSLPSVPSTVQALVVAGGGGGGGGTGGGGGAGGVLYNAALATAANTPVSVTVGTGGTGGGNYIGATTLPGNNGTNSVFSSLTAIGGGGGGANNLVVGRAGGSGGGGAHDSNGGAGTAGQGNAGGTGINGSTNYGASGGGGAASAGIGGTTTQGGNGGAGVANSITGSSVTYGGGGGGGIYATASNFGLGGTGGGGNGGSSAGGGGNGTNGLGGGGGGAGNNNSSGGTGGNGVVIVRYTGNGNNAIVSGGSATTVGGDTVWTFNSNGSFTPVGCTGSCGLTVNAGSISFGGAVGGTTPLGASAFTSTNSLNLSQNITASSVLARTTGATSDITIAATRSITGTGAGNAITIASGQNFINNSGLGTGTLNLTGGGRYLIYSVQPSSDTSGGLVRDFRRFSCSYASAGNCLFNATINSTVSIPTTGNGFIYSSTPSTLTLTISSIGNVTYGNSVNLTNIAVNPTTVGQYLNASDFANDVITGSINGSTTYVPGPANGGLGTYNINYASGQLISDLGYNILYANNPSAFTVVPRAVTVSLVGTVSKVYDQNTLATLAGGNYSISNVFAGDVLGISNTAGTYDTKNVGVGKTVTVTGLTLTGAPVANYVLSSGTATGNVGTITQRALTISATSPGKVYDGTTTTTATLSDNRIAGDVLTLGYGTALYSDKNVGVGKTVTVSGITLGNTDAGNYTFNTTATTTANITQRALTISATSPGKVYDGTTVTTATLSDNRVAGDVLTLGYGTALYSDKNVGVGKTVTVSGITLGNTDAGNYTFNTTATTTADITQRALTIGVSSVGKVYDGTLIAPFTFSDNRVAGDVLTLGYGTALFPDKNVGVGKTVTVSGITLGNTDAGNYTFNTTATTTANITQRALTIGVSSVGKVYDGTLIAPFTFSDNRVAGDVLTLGYGTALFPDKNVGVGKTVTVSGITLGNTDAGNYTFNTTATTTANITQRALTVSATSPGKVYDGTLTAPFTFSDNRVSGDVLTLGYGTALFPDKNVGVGKTVTVSGITLGNTDAGNYTFNTTATTTADITQRALTINVTSPGKVYDGTLTAPFGFSDNRVSGDVLTLGYGTALFPDKNVGTGRLVTVNGITLSNTDAGNYSFNTSATTTANITQRALTVTASGINKVYDGLTTAGITLSDNRIGGDNLTLSYGTALFLNKNVGVGKTVNVSGIGVTGLDIGNYTFNTTATTSADISPRPLTVSASAASKTYDGTATATATLSDDRVAGDVLTLGYGTALFPDKNVGTARTVTVGGITVGNTDAGNYTYNTTALASADITPALLIATADTQNATYGSLVPAGSISYTGFVVGDSAASLATAPTVSSTLSGVQHAGTYAGNYTVSGGVDSNYSFSYVAGNLVITKKDLNVTADTQTISYGNPVPAGSLSYSGFIAGDSVASLISAPIVSSSLSGLQNVGSYVGNYTVSGGVTNDYVLHYFSGDLVVTPRDLNVSADNKTVNYGVAVPGGTLTYSGFIPGQDASFLAVLPTVSSALSGIQNAGTYSGNYTASGGSDTNYHFIYTPGTLTVTPTGLNVTVSNQAVTYGTAVPTSSITYTGFIAGENASFLTTQPTVSSGLSGIQHAGTYSANYTASGGVSSNYTFNYIPGDLTVTPKALNVTAGNRTVTYGTAVPATSLAYTGFIPGEDATFLIAQPTVSSAQSGIIPAGVYNGNYTVSGGVSNDYSFNYVPGNLNVSQKTLTISAVPQTIVYGTAVPAGSISYSGFIAGENASFLTTQPTLSSGLSGVQPVGTYSNNYTVGGAVSNNYSFAYLAGDLVVGQRTLNVTAQSQTIGYGTVVPTTGIVYSGFAPGENASFLTTLPTTSSALSGIQNAGSYAGNYSVGGGVAANYLLVYTAGNLTVIPANVDITANNVTRAYGAPNTLNGYTITGLQNGDTIGSVTLTTPATLSSSLRWQVGNWNITPSAASGGSYNPANYAFTYHNGTLTITPRALTISATSPDKFYDASASTTATLSDDRVSGDILFTNYGSASFANAHAGVNRTVTVSGITLTGADLANYTFNTTATTIATINRRALTVLATANNKIFDGTATATVTLTDNRLSGDSFTVHYANASFPDSAVGTGRIVTVSGISLSGANANDYTPNSLALAIANILPSGVLPPPPPPTMNGDALPNTVVKVSQDLNDTHIVVMDDGVFATPASSYVLVYLPSGAPVQNRVTNTPVPAQPKVTADTNDPDQEKRLRQQRESHETSI